jgi:3-(3-hydroxy-phenyl)propionate hydroxylase
MTDNRKFDVVIVGYGPAGAIAACWLGQAGIETLAVEKNFSIWEIPRAVALDHEILRVFQNIGIVDRVLPYTAPFGASEHFGAKGQLIRRIDVVPPPYPLGYLPNMVFTQPRVETVIRNRVAEHDSVTVKLGHEVIALVQDQDGTALTLRDQAGNSDSIRTRFVIGCDGASSTIRRLLQISLEDLGFDEPWLVVDVLVNENARGKLPSICAQYCDPERPSTYIIGPGYHRRWEIMLSAGEDPREVELEERVWQLLSRWLKPSDGELWRASSYRFHALVAQRWRDRHVFIGGDAAHQQPPFIGQGMCQGVRDVTNLCWKLISVLHDESTENLLDTYEQERKQHVLTLTQRIKKIGAAICIRDPESARERDEKLLEQGGGKAPVVTRQEIVPPLDAGLVRPEPGHGAGTIFPQPRILSAAGSVLMDELKGTVWRLVVDGRSASEFQALDGSRIKTIVLGGTGLQEVEGVAAAWFDAHQCCGAIVRPDHYVYSGITDLHEANQLWYELEYAMRAELPAGNTNRNALLEIGASSRPSTPPI